MDFKKIACAYHPTTITTVDDNQKFLELISLKISKNLPVKSFSDSGEALKFLKFDNKIEPFIDRCLIFTEDNEKDRRTIDVDISAISQEIYYPQRYEEISVVVVDYAMPGMNGGEFCKQLKDARYKIILLTGEAGLETAIQLFNAGVINRYLHKNEADYIDKLTHAIAELQHEYFIDLSKIVVDTIIKQSNAFDLLPSCLSDPIFINFFDQFIEKHKFTEYYLYDDSGSFLFLDDKGKISWLIVQNQGQMEATEFEIKDDEKLSSTIRQQINNKELLCHFFNDNEPSPISSEEWKQFLYPATKLEGKSNYYYSYIEKPLTRPNIDTDKIITYDKYRRGN